MLCRSVRLPFDLARLIKTLGTQSFSGLKILFIATSSWNPEPLCGSWFPNWRLRHQVDVLDRQWARIPRRLGHHGPSTASEIFAAGVDLLRRGRPCWDAEGTLRLVESESRVVRPINYAAEYARARGAPFFEAGSGRQRVAVVHVQGAAAFHGRRRLENPFWVMGPR